MWNVLKHLELRVTRNHRNIYQKKDYKEINNFFRYIYKSKKEKEKKEGSMKKY